LAGGEISVEAPDLAVWQGPVAGDGFAQSGGPCGRDGLEGNWQLQVPDTLRLLRAMAIIVPANLPNLQELDVQGQLATAGGQLWLPRTKVNGRLLEPA